MHEVFLHASPMTSKPRTSVKNYLHEEQILTRDLDIYLAPILASIMGSATL